MDASLTPFPAMNPASPKSETLKENNKFKIIRNYSIYIFYLLAIDLDTRVRVIDTEDIAGLQVTVDDVSCMEGLHAAGNIPESLDLELLAGTSERLVYTAERDELRDDVQHVCGFGDTEELHEEVRVGRNVHERLDVLCVVVQCLRRIPSHLK